MGRGIKNSEIKSLLLSAILKFYVISIISQLKLLAEQIVSQTVSSF